VKSPQSLTNHTATVAQINEAVGDKRNFIISRNVADQRTWNLGVGA
jgi:hypothetical protein